MNMPLLIQNTCGIMDQPPSEINGVLDGAEVWMAYTCMSVNYFFLLKYCIETIRASLQNFQAIVEIFQEQRELFPRWYKFSGWWILFIN